MKKNEGSCCLHRCAGGICVKCSRNVENNGTKLYWNVIAPYCRILFSDEQVLLHAEVGGFMNLLDRVGNKLDVHVFVGYWETRMHLTGFVINDSGCINVRNVNGMWRK